MNQPQVYALEGGMIAGPWRSEGYSLVKSGQWTKDPAEKDRESKGDGKNITYPRTIFSAAVFRI